MKNEFLDAVRAQITPTSTLFRVHNKIINYDRKSLYLFSGTSRFRYAVVYLVESR